MSWLLRDERHMRRHRPPAQHHEPPLGKEDCIYPEGYHVLNNDGCCGDCGWIPDGWEPCELHQDAKEPK